MSKLIFEFPNDKIRDAFLGQFCDGGGEDALSQCMEDGHNIKVSVDYKKAFKAWGWDGKGDPTVIVDTYE